MQLIYFKKLCKGQAGSALLGLIVTMVFLSALAAAMIAQTTTGSLGFVNENSSLRAYYLAESGFRYAAAKLKNTGELALDTLHNHGPFSLGNNGSFTLQFATYIFEITGGIGTNELVTRVSFGKAPPLLAGMSGYVKLVNNSVQAFNPVTIDASPNDNIVRFTSTQIWNDVFVGESVKLVTKSNADNVSEGGELNLQPGGSGAFPQYNGRFEVNGKIYRYKERKANKLVGITCVDDSTTWPLSVLYGDDIVLQAFAQLVSTGTYGEGDMAVSREIVYNIPVSEKEEFHDTFEDKSHWEEVSTLGTHDIAKIGGDSVLKVTRADSVGVADDVGSLIKLESSRTDEMLRRAHASAGDFLSYDAQVKVGFDPGIPSTYMAGISFRQDAEDRLEPPTSTGNSYGVSFLKAGSSDRIPDDLCPDFDTNIIENVPLLVLWQQTNSGTDRKWLAYKELMGRPVYLSDDMESGTNGWASDGLWNTTDHRYKSSSHSWYYGQSGIWHYDTGAINSGNLTSPSIDLTTASSPSLTFWSWYQTEPQDQYVNIYDLKYLYILDQNGNTLKYYQIISPGPGKPAPALPVDKLEQVMETWNQLEIDLSPYVGQIIKVRFYFNTRDAVFNNHEGWYIDDVIIAEDFPINEATIMARVKEAATVSFTSGGTTPIEVGDIVTQTNGARGTVIETPILESGGWDGTAAGIILLNKLPRNIDGTITTHFADGLALNVNGVQRATAALSNSFRPRDNYIRVFYGDKDGYGTPGTDPLDYDKHGNPRGELHWPPDELEDWSADNDYFTLVQWDEVEDVAVSSLDKVSSLDEPDAILRTNELITSTGTFTDTEIGLHTFGVNSTRVYFDDFGLQTVVPTQEGFLPAIQQ